MPEHSFRAWLFSVYNPPLSVTTHKAGNRVLPLETPIPLGIDDAKGAKKEELKKEEDSVSHAKRERVEHEAPHLGMSKKAKTEVKPPKWSAAQLAASGPSGLYGALASCTKLHWSCDACKTFSRVQRRCGGQPAHQNTPVDLHEAFDA